MIRRLTLTNFRNYHAASLEIGAQTVVLIGPNGAGKTNLIEAISFLAPGRGLRRATLDEVAFSEGDGSWAAFADHLRVVWLTPAMDTLFAGAPSERRRFLDRLVLAVDAEHASRVTALERSLRSRNRLLEQPGSNPHWLDAVEHETAELAVAVASQRVETVRRLEAVLASRKDVPFPSAAIALDGWMEELLPAHPAVEIEERYRAVLRENRARDAAAGRTLDGPHLTDLKVIYAPKSIAA